MSEKKPPGKDLRIEATPEGVAKAILRGGAPPKKRPPPAPVE